MTFILKADAGNGNPPPKDKPMREQVPPVEPTDTEQTDGTQAPKQ